MSVPVLRFNEFSGDWIQLSLGKITMTLTSGSRDWAKYYAKSGSKFIRMTNLSRDGIRLKLDDLKFVNVDTDSADGKRTSLAHGDILISITAELGKIGWIPPDFGEAFINQHTALLRLDDTKADSRCVAHILVTPKLNKIINRMNDAGAKAGLNLPTIKAIKLHLPEKSEQTKIANFLTAVDEKITQLTQKCELLAQYKKGVMQQIFSQELRFKDDDGQDFPAWQEHKISELFHRSAHVTKTEHITNDGKYIIVDMGSISREAKLLGTKRTNYTQDFLSTNDLIMAKDDIGGGHIIGRVVLIPEDNKYICGDHVYKLTIKHGYIQYFYYAINSYKVNRSFRQKANGTAQIGISNKTVDDQLVPTPCIREQTKIANFLTAVDAKLTNTQNQLAAAKQYKQGLLQQMFV